MSTKKYYKFLCRKQKQSLGEEGPYVQEPIEFLKRIGYDICLGALKKEQEDMTKIKMISFEI